MTTSQVSETLARMAPSTAQLVQGQADDGAAAPTTVAAAVPASLEPAPAPCPMAQLLPSAWAAHQGEESTDHQLGGEIQLKLKAVGVLPNPSVNLPAGIWGQPTD